MLLVKEYAEYKVEFPNPPPSEDKKDERRTDDILPWDKEFMNKLEQSVLFDLIMVCGVAFPFFAAHRDCWFIFSNARYNKAANYLEMKDLLDLGCKTVANMIKGKSVEGVYTQNCLLSGLMSVLFLSIPSH